MNPRSGLITLSVLFLSALSAAHGADGGRVTNIYDAFGEPNKALLKDWGYSALVEYGGKRILFDTGNHADIFENNVKALGIDLTRLDAVVISHRHGDHTSGLTYLLKVNPGVAIYVPQEGAFFKGRIPPDFLEREPGLPPSLQYFEGKDFTRPDTGSPWQEANFRIVTGNQEMFPGFELLLVQSQKPGTIEMNELSLAIRTPQGLAVVVGCSHPGVEKILAEAAKLDPHLYTVTGGFHLVRTPLPEVTRVATSLHDSLHLNRVAPAHCTSERGFAVFRRVFGERFDPAGLGASIVLP